MQSIKYISSLNLLELYAPMLNVVKQFHPYIYLIIRPNNTNK